MMTLDDFRSYLVHDLKRRQTKNASYSLTAFARDLEMSAQKLSQVLKGRSGLSRAAASSVADHLGLDEKEREHFLALVDSKHARSELLRQSAIQKVETLRQQNAFKQLNPERGLPLVDWLSWACYMLVEVKDFKPDFDWISNRLNAPIEKVIGVFDQLFERGLLTSNESGQWVKVDANVEFASPSSTKEIRGFYRSVLEKSQDTIEAVAPTERHFHVALMTVRADDYEEIKMKIDEFSKSLIQEYSQKPGDSDRVYCMSTGFVPYDKLGD